LFAGLSLRPFDDCPVFRLLGCLQLPTPVALPDSGALPSPSDLPSPHGRLSRECIAGNALFLIAAAHWRITYPAQLAANATHGRACLKSRACPLRLQAKYYHRPAKIHCRPPQHSFGISLRTRRHCTKPSSRTFLSEINTRRAKPFPFFCTCYGGCPLNAATCLSELGIPPIWMNDGRGHPIVALGVYGFAFSSNGTAVNGRRATGNPPQP